MLSIQFTKAMADSFNADTGDEFRFADVVTVDDVGYFQLSDGRIIAPAHILTPFFLFWHAPEFRDLRQREYGAYLTGLMRGATVHYKIMGGRDRYGRERAIIRNADYQDLATHLIKSGLVVYDGQAQGDLHKELLATEDQARRNQILRSIWAIEGGLSILKCHSKLKNSVGRFMVAIGQVVAVNRVRKDIYINFGDDWREDFTLLVTNVKEAEAHFYEQLLGQWVDARGWVTWRGGPMIILDRPEFLRPIAVTSPEIKLCDSTSD